MKQEVEVTLTLEVDVNQNKEDIEKFIDHVFYCFKYKTMFYELIKIKLIKEESELYDAECNLDYKKLNEKFTNKLYSFSKKEILEYLKTI